MQNVLDLNNIIECSHLSKTYSTGEVALSDVSCAVRRGEFLAIIGASGCGKSTLLKIIAGIETPTSGSIARSQKIAMVFQSGALFPWLSVFENVAVGLRAEKLSEAVIERRVNAYLDLTGLQSFAQKVPAELSGGQHQRVGLARALAVEPQVLLLDESFSALDPKMAADLHEDILRIWKHTGVAIIMVSHLIEEAAALADRILLMGNGSIKKEFNISLSHPRREQGAEFMRDVQMIRKEFFTV